QPKRQELYRPGWTARRRTGPRDCLLRRPGADYALRRQGRRDTLRQHGLCPLRTEGLNRRLPRRIDGALNENAGVSAAFAFLVAERAIDLAEQGVDVVLRRVTGVAIELRAVE